MSSIKDFIDNLLAVPSSKRTFNQIVGYSRWLGNLIVATDNYSLIPELNRLNKVINETKHRFEVIK